MNDDENGDTAATLGEMTTLLIGTAVAGWGSALDDAVGDLLIWTGITIVLASAWMRYERWRKRP